MEPSGDSSYFSSETKPRLSGRSKHKTILVFVAILLALAAAEVAFRVHQHQTRTGVLTDRPVLDLYPDVERPEEVFSLVGPEQLDWAPYEHWVIQANLRSRFYRTNALGFRGPETSVEKALGRFRVVVLGGSAAWGYGSTADDRTVPGRLQVLLKEQYPAREIEVINAAQIGYVSGQQVSYFHRFVKRLCPDLVLFLDGYNDVSADFQNPVSGWPQNAALLKARYDASWRQRTARDDLAALLRRSRLVDFLWGRFFPELDPKAMGREISIPADETARNYVTNVQTVTALASPGEVIVALQPTVATTRKPLARQEEQILARKERQIPGFSERVKAAYAEMAVALDAAGIRRVDLAGALGTEAELLFADECHFGDVAADRIARAVAPALGQYLAADRTSDPPARPQAQPADTFR